jgi:uncharacterized membrane protein
MIRLMLWYQAEVAPNRVAFAGGVVAGSLIPLVIGLMQGFTYEVVAGSAFFSVIMFVVFVGFAGVVFKAGTKHGDKKPAEDILEEAEHGDSSEQAH